MIYYTKSVIMTMPLFRYVYTFQHIRVSLHTSKIKLRIVLTFDNLWTNFNLKSLK